MKNNSGNKIFSAIIIASKTNLWATFTALIFLFSACQKDNLATQPGEVAIEFDHIWGNQTLKFGFNYTTAAGDTVNFNTFKYYISNVKLNRKDGTSYTVPPEQSYFLVNHESDSTKILKFKNVPAGEYTGVTFTVGIDSAMSVSSIEKRTGVLDPATGAQGMYWSWNSGYIFVKVEGESPSGLLDSVRNKRVFLYHVGGFGGFSAKTINNIKVINLKSDNEVALVNGSKRVKFHLTTDLSEFFKNPTAFKIKDNPIVHFAPFNTVLSANYVDMFKIDHIHN